MCRKACPFQRGTREATIQLFRGVLIPIHPVQAGPGVAKCVSSKWLVDFMQAMWPHDLRRPVCLFRLVLVARVVQGARVGTVLSAAGPVEVTR